MKEKNKDVVFFRDDFVPSDEANISILSAVAQYGMNVFEGLRGYYNHDSLTMNVFQLSEHISRLLCSARMLKFKLDPAHTQAYIEQKVKELIKLNAYAEDIYIRVCLFLDNFWGWSSQDPVSLIINAFPKGRAFSDLEGLRCCVSSWRRINDSSFPPRIKAGPNYLNSRLSLLEAKQNGYDYPILLNDRSTVAEGPGACLFIVRNGSLITPPVYASVLESITRNAVIDMARSILKVPVIEREIDRTELYMANEIFFVGTAIEIMPVESVDGIQVRDFSERPITREVLKHYFKIARNEIDHFAE
jgi:branched-chain amino acid aminotransferase